jgi:hypothetical protein
MKRDEFDALIEMLPEPKLQLIDGRFVVGNDDAGNRQLLLELLKGWGPESVLHMAPSDRWWQALASGFRSFDPPAPTKPPDVWRRWAAQLNYAPELPSAGPMIDVKHRGCREGLSMSLFRLLDHRYALVSGRDVIMRLGDDAFTPDVFAVGPSGAGRLNKHYLDGPADLAVEVLAKGRARQDIELKRQRYEKGGVHEYWLVDPERESVECLVRRASGFAAAVPDADGSYRSSTFPGLRFHPKNLWQHDGWGHGPEPFTREGSMPEVARGYADGGIAWGDVAFDPGPDLEPRRISFAEFASWAPRAKFEWIDGKPWVGGSRGSRNALGLLLRTAGLIEGVTVLHPNRWIAALIQANEERANDAARRDHWWDVARRVAAFVRKKTDCRRIAVIGDLVKSEPLNLWSEIRLVIWQQGRRRDLWRLWEAMHKQFRDEPDVEFVEPKHATGAEREAIQAEAIDL